MADGTFRVNNLAKAAADTTLNNTGVQVGNGATLVILGEKVKDVFTVETLGAKLTANTALKVAEQKGALLVVGNHEAAAKAYQAKNSLDNTIYVGDEVTFATAPTFGTKATNGKNAVVIDMGALANSGYVAQTTSNAKATVDHNVITVAGTDTSIQGVDKVAIEGFRNLSKNSLVWDKDAKAYKLLLGDVTTTSQEVKVTDTGYVAASLDANGDILLQANEPAVIEVRRSGLHTREAIAYAAENLDFTVLNDVSSGIFFNDNATLNAYLDARNAEWAAFVQANPDIADVKLDALQQDFEDATDDVIVDAENATTNMAVAGGAFSAALDYQNEVVSALDRRTTITNLNSARGEVGVTPWVDVFGTTNEAKRLYGSNAGYEADIYGAVLGFDYTAACGGVLGVAFNVGTGDGNSVGDGAKVDNDADYYDFSVYAAKQFGSFNVKADFGYTQASNDLSTTNVLGSFKESLDADLWTFGVGSEFLLQAGSVNVVPHAGIRMTRLSMDDSKYGADYDDMTVYQLPLGVAVSSTFETNGWKLAPMADISVVPTFGDKDAVATYFGGITETTRVVDTNPVQGTLGVEAQNGAFTFGLNYRLTAGGDDRMNNSFNANVRYAF